MKVAIIHDWLVVVAGTEKVLGEILELFPQAKLFCLLDFLPTKESCYVYSPMRYAWDLQSQYLQQAGLKYGIKSWLTRWMLHKLRIWDAGTAHRIDHYIANSLYSS